MKRTFRPRGIIKWHPFASLYDPIAESFAVDALNQTLSMQELSEEQISKINQQIHEVYEKQWTVQIRYFVENKFAVLEGKISKIDIYNERVKIADSWIYLSTIVDII